MLDAFDCGQQLSLEEVEDIESVLEVDQEIEAMIISDENDMGQVRPTKDGVCFCSININTKHRPSLRTYFVLYERASLITLKNVGRAMKHCYSVQISRAPDVPQTCDGAGVEIVSEENLNVGSSGLVLRVGGCAQLNP